MSIQLINKRNRLKVFEHFNKLWLNHVFKFLDLYIISFLLRTFWSAYSLKSFELVYFNITKQFYFWSFIILIVWQIGVYIYLSVCKFYYVLYSKSFIIRNLYYYHIPTLQIVFISLEITLKYFKFASSLEGNIFLHLCTWRYRALIYFYIQHLNL